ncbi:MAG: hypothetical protein ACLSCF_11070, partial [Alistipes finegoldii]
YADRHRSYQDTRNSARRLKRLKAIAIPSGFPEGIFYPFGEKSGKADYDEIPCFRKNRPIYTKRTSENKRSCLTSPIFRISPPSDKTLAG